MQQHYELGLWLRKRYISLLKNDYSKTDVYIQSTDVDRTLMSAESNLAGLFPPRGSRMFEPGLKWQPIPVHTIPEHLDHVSIYVITSSRFVLKKNFKMLILII